MVFVCFSAFTASDRPSWSSGLQEIFEETSEVHFIFLFCWVFVELLLLEKMFMANAYLCHHLMFNFKLSKSKSNTLSSAFLFETFEYPYKLRGSKKAEQNQSLKLKVCFCYAEILPVELQTQGCEFTSGLN